MQDQNQEDETMDQDVDNGHPDHEPPTFEDFQLFDLEEMAEAEEIEPEEALA